MTARPRSLFQGQRRALLLIENLAAIFFPAQFLYERERGIAGVRVSLRRAGGALPAPGDVILVMSNGGFDGVQEKILRALAG